MSAAEITAPVPISRCRLFDDPDCGQRDGPDDHESRRFGKTVVERDLVADVLVQQSERGRSERHLVGRIEPVP